MQDEKQYRIDNAFGWQIDRPVFVKLAFTAFGKKWERGDEFNWINQNFREEDWEQQLFNVANLYNSEFLHHDTSREKANKVGDRLSELNGEELYRLVAQLNAEVKERTSGSEEFAKKKCKISKIDDKQRGLIRRWLRSNPWAQDLFYEKRDYILGE
jgi:hypothetical protein